MAEDEGTEKKGGLSFGFSKKKETKTLKKSAVSDGVETKGEETDFVFSFEGKEVKSSKPKATESKQLVIPLIEVNNWRTPYLEKNDEKLREKTKRKTDEAKEDREDDLSQQAAKEILEAAALQNQNWDERGQPDPNLAVPLLVRNKVPDGFETDDKLNVELRPDGPEDANYDEIPIEQFGFAMLRGMGWKDGEGIGKNKEVVAPLDAAPRPKGLGLGADKSTTLQKNNGVVSNSKSKDDEESLVLKNGAYCVVKKGPNKDLYGVVQGVDEDNARVVVKLTLSSKTVTISQYAVDLVPKKDYEKFSKYLNKAKVDKFKEEQSNREKKSRSRERSRSPHSKEKKKKHRNRSRSPDDRKRNARSRSPNEKYDSHNRSKDSQRDKKRKYDTNHSDDDVSDNKSRDKKVKKSKHSADKKPSTLWVRPDIRVRIIDKNYKSGKYYKSKVVIEDVVSLDNCVCRTEEGKVLEGLSQSVLETVIPKNDSAHVLIVSGKSRGQIGELVKRSKDTCEALIQLFSDRDTVLRLGYDDICEYVGNIDHEFHY